MNKLTTITSADADSKVLIRSSSGGIASITIGTTSAHALTFYDDTSITSPANKFFKAKLSVAEQTFLFNGVIETGIVVDVPAGYAGECTIAHSS